MSEYRKLAQSCHHIRGDLRNNLRPPTWDIRASPSFLTNLTEGGDLLEVLPSAARVCAESEFQILKQKCVKKVVRTHNEHDGATVHNHGISAALAKRRITFPDV